MKRRIMSVVRVLCMLMSVLSVGAVTAGAKTAAALIYSGNGTQESPYQISSAQELRAFAENVNNGNNYSGEYVELTTDIDLREEEWTPIGHYVVRDDHSMPDEIRWLVL